MEKGCKLCVYLVLVLLIFAKAAVQASVVDLSSKKLNKIPGWIDAGVTHLCLQYNHLTEVENNTFTGHVHIVSLNLGANDIRSVESNAFYGLDSLKELRLWWNEIGQQPDLSSVSGSLEYLDLSGNQISATLLPEITMPKLKELRLNINNIGHFSSARIRYVTPNLLRLRCTECRIINASAEYFSSMPKLEQLFLSDNLLETFSPRLLNISKNIQYLQFSFNQLQILEEDSFLGYINLQDLFLSNNKLREFDMHKITNGTGLPVLKGLDLSGNNLSTLPPSDLWSSTIETLSLGYNKIDLNTSEIPLDYFANLTNLHTLNFEQMNLFALPDLRSSLNSLQVLNLKDNHVSALNISQAFVSQVPNLKTLQLNNNGLAALVPNAAIFGLTKLDLSNNRLESIPENYFDQMPLLEELDLRNNLLTNLTISSNLTNLKTILLNGNGLKSFPRLPHIIQTVRHLDLSGNPIQSITLTDIFSLPTQLAKELTTLVLNGLTSLLIPDDVWCSMPNLNALHLDNVQLGRFPDVRCLSKLKKLYLSNNNIRDTGDITYLKQNELLEILDLSKNNLTYVDGILEVAYYVTSSELTVNLEGNDNLRCDTKMCWVKYLNLK